MTAAYLKAEQIWPEREPGCTGKRGYSRQIDAKRKAKLQKLKFPPYLCKNCGYWHITGIGKVGDVS